MSRNVGYPSTVHLVCIMAACTLHGTVQRGKDLPAVGLFRMQKPAALKHLVVDSGRICKTAIATNHSTFPMLTSTNRITVLTLKMNQNGNTCGPIPHQNEVLILRDIVGRSDAVQIVKEIPRGIGDANLVSQFVHFLDGRLIPQCLQKSNHLGCQHLVVPDRADRQSSPTNAVLVQFGIVSDCSTRGSCILRAMNPMEIRLEFCSHNMHRNQSVNNLRHHLQCRPSFHRGHSHRACTHRPVHRRHFGNRICTKTP